MCVRGRMLASFRILILIREMMHPTSNGGNLLLPAPSLSVSLRLPTTTTTTTTITTNSPPPPTDQVYIIEREFLSAALWMLIAACLSFVGAIHSFYVSDSGVYQNYGFPPSPTASGSRTSNHDFVLQYTSMYIASAGVLVCLYVLEADRSLRAWGAFIRNTAHRRWAGLCYVVQCQCVRPRGSALEVPSQSLAGALGGTGASMGSSSSLTDLTGGGRARGPTGGAKGRGSELTDPAAGVDFRA